MENQNQKASAIFPSDGIDPSLSSPMTLNGSASSLSSLPGPLQDSNVPLPPVKKPENIFLRLLRRADVALALLLVLGSLGLVVNALVSKQSSTDSKESAVNQFDTTQIPLQELITADGLDFGTQNVTINGQLILNDSLIVTPGTQPTSAVAGQIYYDQTSNVLAYYNGTQFIPVSGGISSIQGGGGITVTNDGNGNLTLTGPGASTVTGVSSLNGLTGGLSVANASASGTTITINDASTSSKGIASFSAANFTVAGGGVNTIQDIGSGASPTFASLNTNTVQGGAGLALQSGGNVSVGTTDSSATLLVVDTKNTAGDPTGTDGGIYYNSSTGNFRCFQGGVWTNCITASGGFVSLQNAYDNSSPAVITLNSTNDGILVRDAASTVGGNLFAVQNNAGSTTYFGVTTTGTSINNSLTIGTPSSQTGSLILSNSGSAFTGTLQVASLGQASTYVLPDSGQASVQICITTGNCAGTGTGVTSLLGGAINRVAKFTASQNVENSTITDDGTNVTTSVDLVIQGGDLTVGLPSSQTGTINLAQSGSAFLGSFVQGALTGNRSYLLPDTGGTVCISTGNCNGAGSPATLQAAYDAGNTITTSDNRNLTFTLADTATDSNFLINLECDTGCGGDGRFAIQDDGTDIVTVVPASMTLGTNVDLFLQGASAFISNPQGQTASESFGLNATVTGANAVAFGNGATAALDAVAIGQGAAAVGSGIAIGQGAAASGSFGGPIAIGDGAVAASWGVAIGSGSSTSGNWGTAVGNDARVTGQTGTAIGEGTRAAVGSIAIGSLANSGGNNRIVIGTSATGTADNQLVFGGSTAVGSYISNAYIGSGVTDTTPQSVTLQGTGGSGSNIAGANFNLAAGRGTGSANGGNLNFQVSVPGSAGVTLNALGTVFSLQGTNGSANFVNAVNSTQAFNVENAAGANLLTADTTNNRVGINLGGSSTPTLASGTGGAEINGALRVSGIGSTTWDTYTTPVGSGVLAKVNIVNQTMNPFGQIMALGLTSGSSDSARGLSIFDARTVAHQPTLAVFAPDENSMVGFSWNGSNSAATVQTSDQASGSSDSFVLQSGNATGSGVGSGNVLLTSGSVTSGTGSATGTLTLQSGNGAGTNSSSGNVLLDAGTRTGSGTAGTITIGGTNASALTLGRTGLATNNAGSFTLGQLGTTDTSAYLCRNTSNILAACSTTGAGAAFVQGGNTFGANGILGTNDGFDLEIERGGTTQLTVGNGAVTLASNVDLLLQGATAYISNPQGTTSSEAFGSGATASGGDRNVVVGNNATVGANNDAVAIGFQAVGADNAVVIGSEADCTNNACIAIGSQATAAFRSLAIGTSSAVGHNTSIAIGAGTVTGGANSIAIGVDAATTAANQLVIGSSGSAISQAVIGNGVTNATPTGFTLQGTGGLGSNIAGASVTIAGGQGTGTGNGGNVNFQIADPGSSGSSLNSLSTVASLSGVNGAATFQNSTDSTSAFRILNAAGTGEHVGVDTLDSILRLLSNNTGHLSGTGGQWNTGTSLPSPARCCIGAVSVNGYLYSLGGDDGGGRLTTVQFARTNSDGSVGTWQTTTSLPVGLAGGGNATSYNGYIYIAGGASTANDSRDVFYAKPNSDGTITNWIRQDDPSGNIDHQNAGLVAYNGYLYITAGSQNDSTLIDDVYYARIQADGSVPSFSVMTNWVPTADSNPGQAIVANGYLYVLGSANYNKFYYGRILPNGTAVAADGSTVIGTLATGTTSEVRKYGALAVMNGYMYAIAGGTSGLDTVEYAPIGNDGDLGTFATDTTVLPALRTICSAAAPVVNNYIYLYGCGDGNFNPTQSVYYAGGSRVKVGGGLDLVGYSGETMTDGGTGGQLTAGNTYVNGTLSVTGNAQLKDGLGVSGALNVVGTQAIKTASNTNNAFTILNSAGTQLLNVGTVHNTNDLVTNGSIEQNTTGWAGVDSATVSRITSQQYVGQASLETVTTASSGDGAKYNVTLASSTQYTVSFYAKLASGSFTNMSFGYASDGVTETDCKTNQQIKTGGWLSFNCTFTTGTVSGSPYFYWKQNSATARTVYTDALQIVPGPDIGAFYEGKINTGGLVFSGPTAVQNDNDSNSAFQVQGSTGTTAFGVDTVNYRVGVNLISSTATLHVLTIGNTSVTALFNQAGTSTEDIMQLQKGGSTTASVTHDGITTFQNLTNSTTSFRLLGSNVTFGSGTPLFVADTTNSRIYIGNPTTDTTGALLVLDTKTSAGDPSTTGMTDQAAMYYNSDSDKMRCYENAVWKNCLGMNESLTFNGTNGDGAASLWPNMPAALTEIWGFNDSRVRYDLTDATQVRLQVNVDTAGVSGSELRAQYSTDQSSWDYLDGGTGPAVAVDAGGLAVSSWVTLTGGAKSDVYLRIIGINGNGTTDPEFGLIQLQIR